MSIVHAQSYELRINKITDEKGEDPGATFAIVEDSTGFIWFGTVDGLYRYDGFNYKVYRNEKDNQNSLAWNTIRALCIGKNNKLWIGTQGAGLECLDLTTNKFTHYSYAENNKEGISGNDIWALTSDRKGNIWVGVVGDGVDMLDVSTNKFTHYAVLPQEIKAIEKITIRSIFEDHNGIIWVGMVNYGLSAIDTKTGKVRNYQNHYDKKSLLSNEIRNIFEDSKGRLWVSCYGGGVNLFDSKTESFIQYKKSESNPNSLVSDLLCAGIEKRTNELWFGTEYGLSIWEVNESIFTTYQHEQTIQNSINDNRIRVIYKDSKDIVWIGSEAGVDKIVEQHNFKIYKNKLGKLDDFPEGIVRSILEDNQKNLWVGIIDKGLIKYNPNTKKIEKFYHDPSNPSSISGYHITSSFQDSNGDLWFGEWDTGLNKYNKDKGTFELVAGTRSGLVKLTDTRIQFIKEARPGVLWVGAEYGLNLFDTRKKTCTYFLHDEKNPNSLSGNSVQSNAFAQDSSGNLWIGTWSEGLNRIEFTDDTHQNAKFTHWKHDPAKPDQLNNNNIISLHLGKNRILWIGTFGGGLNRFDIKTGLFKHYTTENGLPNNVIFGILEDNNNNLWLSTDRGLSKFDPKLETFQNYSKTDGLQDDHFFWGSEYKSISGELFFGGINGLNSFVPENIINNTYEPKAVITDFKIFEKSFISDLPLSGNSELKLPYTKNYLTFEYAALDFSEPGKNLYMIKMEGVDNEWHNNSNRRIAAYPNLSPDKYTFRLKVANNDGVWSKDELKINIIISPPWWNTWLARTLFIILIAGSILGFYFIRVGVLTAQTRKLEEQVVLRTQEIENQKRELQATNNILYQQKEELSETVHQLKETQRQLVESEKMASLGILTAGVAHEINNPLNFIQAGIYGLENYFEDNPDCSKNCNSQDEVSTILDRMKIGVSRVSGIVTSLNHFSRQTESIDQDCDIQTIIDNCLLILNNQIKYKAEIKKNYNADNSIIVGNEGKLHQLFLNIIGNSIHAINDKGTIEITTDYSNNILKVSIKDNGCGISKENLEKIFDPFFTTKEVGVGTGLGLSIAYGIVKDHNGSIEFKSEVGFGTEAIIKLPKNS